MVATAEESIASLRLLVSVAKADGVLHEREQESLQAALSELGPAAPEGLDPDLALGLLLGENMDLDAILATIRSDEARQQAYGAAYAIANADGECSAEEKAVLDRVRRAFGISQERQRYLEQVFLPRGGVVRRKEGATPAFDGLERKAKVEAETRKTAIVCALLGAFPFPVIAIGTDLAIVAMQVALAKDIARFWGKEMDTEKIKGLMAGFGVGTGARIAVTNLLKIFPGWGSAAGAAAAYASTYAVGRVLSEYFEKGQGDPSELKARFQRAQKEGKEAFKADKAEIDKKAEAHGDELAELGKKLEAGELTQAEFEQKAAELE